MCDTCGPVFSCPLSPCPVPKVRDVRMYSRRVDGGCCPHSVARFCLRCAGGCPKIVTLQSSKIEGKTIESDFFKARDSMCMAQPALLCCNGNIFFCFFALRLFELETTVLEEHLAEYQQCFNC